ncbi:hypothetical protein GQX74_012377 [Glossina fuscipes]|nr:hypothetical protein GQX74_012377 [Glossina fuscipes]
MDLTPPKITFFAISKPRPFKPDNKISEDSSISPVAPSLWEFVSIGVAELLALLLLLVLVFVVGLGFIIELLLLALILQLEPTTLVFSCSLVHEELCLSLLLIFLLSLFTADDVLMPPPLFSLVVLFETSEPAAFLQLDEANEQDDNTNDAADLPAVVSLLTLLSISSPAAPLPLLLFLWELVEVGDELGASFRFLATGGSAVVEAACSANWELEDIGGQAAQVP